MCSRASVIVFSLLGILLRSSPAASQSAVAGNEGKVVAATQQVFVTLRIADMHSGLVLDAKRSVPKGSNAFEVLRDTVTVKYRAFGELGAFVTGLCGVDAPEGMVWTFTVNKKWSKVGIEGLKLEQDTLIEWNTR